jgi:hypothetical protein
LADYKAQRNDPLLKKVCKFDDTIRGNEHRKYGVRKEE